MFGKVSANLRTLRVRILAIVALCWLLPTMVLGVYMSGVFFDALRAKTEQALVAGALHAQELVVREIERILKKSKDVTYDEQLFDRMVAYKAGEIGFEEYYITCRAYWQRMFQRERLLDFTAFFLTEEPELLLHTAEYATTLLAFEKNALPYIREVSDEIDTRSRFVYIDRHLYHVRNLLTRRLERFGTLVLGIDVSGLFAPFLGKDTLWQGDVDILLDEYARATDAENALTPDTYREGLYQQDGDIYYGGRTYTSDYTLTYRIRLDASVAFGQTREYYRLILLLLVLLLPLEALIMLFIHRSITRPLMQLSSATARLAKGELGVTVPTKGPDEIGRLGMAFNAMSLRIKRLIDKSYREELALRDARISALQSRINPHFMNNALELMNWQARMEGAESVSQMIEAMSTLINAALDRSEQRTVPLREEVAVADAYFFFIIQRFGERVHIEKEIDPALADAQVPRLIIQTLLENAVEHGINPAGGGAIRLEAYAASGALHIDVRNNGQALTPEARAKVEALLSDPGREAQSEHLGIHNINLRLKLIYRDQAKLTLYSDELGETVAAISIPLDMVLPKSDTI